MKRFTYTHSRSPACTHNPTRMHETLTGTGDRPVGAGTAVSGQNCPPTAAPRTRETTLGSSALTESNLLHSRPINYCIAASRRPQNTAHHEVRRNAADGAHISWLHSGLRSCPTDIRMNTRTQRGLLPQKPCMNSPESLYISKSPRRENEKNEK